MRDTKFHKWLVLTSDTFLKCTQNDLDPEMGNWTVKLGSAGGFFRLSDWSVDWVEIKMDAPKITFRCNVNALLDPTLTDAVRSTTPLEKDDKTSVGSNCQATGKFF